MSAFSHPTSDPLSDPKGWKAPSTRDVLAANIVAALLIKATGHSTHPGSKLGKEAYQLADSILEARAELAQEAESKKP